MPKKKSGKMSKKAVKDYEKELKQALLDNLAARGLVEEVYVDKVDEYMDLWWQRMMLKEDIEFRGVTVWDGKREMAVENRSVSLEVQISRQMLAIFTALGFKDISVSAKPCGGGEDDDL